VPVDIKLKIGIRIKELRELKTMSQQDLSLAAGIDRSYIAGVESGKRNISIVNIEKIVVALGISIKDFFDNSLYDYNRRSSKKL
jgi:transcriptional regulator with XRE-family HTH domain